MTQLMKCGCAANAVNANGEPVCAVHIGILDGATVVNDKEIDFSNRIAKCTYCKTERPSSLNLAFFHYGYWWRGEFRTAHDTFYCGCYGWD